MKQIMEPVIRKGLNCTKDFPILHEKKLVYLDNSATTQKPTMVIEAIKDFYETSNANVHRGIYHLSQKSTRLYEQAHQVVANFIGASFEEVIFTKGTTESLNLLAYSLGKNLQQGDEIILSEMEHHSNIVPWQQIAKEKGAVIKFIPITTDYRLDLPRARELITEKTKIVAVTHMSNVLGTINPVKELAALTHQVGAVMIVDAAQSVPHLPINVKELDCDFMAFSGHKMCGPTGIGVLYGKKELLEKMSPFLYGGDMISEVTFEDSTWNELPWKFEAGTPNIAQAIGLAAAINYLQGLGMEKIAQHGQELTEYALEKLAGLSGITIIGPSTMEDRGPVFSFTVEGIHPHDISELLDRENIAVRGGHHCAMPLHSKLKLTGTTRASFYLYNTTSEIDQLIQGLYKVQEKMRSEFAMINKNEITSGSLTEEEEIYKENIIDHYKYPHNKGELAEYTCKHTELNPLCGDQLTLYLKLEQGKISNVTFTGQGCAISQASVSMLTDHIKGLSIEEAQGINKDVVFGLLGIKISHMRVKCALLSLKTLQNGLGKVK